MVRRMLFVIVSALALVFAPVLAPAPAAAAPRVCECVDYIKARFGFTSATGDAKNMGGYLTRNGFRQVSTPSAGAIVIFQPSFGPGIRAAGHVGVIESVSSVNSNRDWRITVRGANQGVAGSAEHGCSNVSSVRYKAFPKTSTSVSYYVRASR